MLLALITAGLFFLLVRETVTLFFLLLDLLIRITFFIIGLLAAMIVWIYVFIREQRRPKVEILEPDDPRAIHSRLVSSNHRPRGA